MTYRFTRDMPPTSWKKESTFHHSHYKPERIATWLALGFIEVVEEEKEEWPKDGDKFWYVRETGVVDWSIFRDIEFCRSVKMFGNFWKTKEEGEKMLLLIKNLLFKEL